MDTPQNVREIIVKHHQTGLYTQQQIANMVGRSRSTVRDVMHHFEREGTVSASRTNRCGRKRSLTSRDERAIGRASLVNPQSTAREIQAEVGGAVAAVSVQTVRRTLRALGRKAYRPTKKPSLTSSRMVNRLRWCRERQHWSTEQWRKVRTYIYCVSE